MTSPFFSWLGVAAWVVGFLGPPVTSALLVPYLVGWDYASRESSYCIVASMVWLPLWATTTLCCLRRASDGRTYYQYICSARAPDSPSVIERNEARPQRTVVLASIKVTPLEI